MTPELERLQQEARDRMAAHPSIKFANAAITAYAVRTGTKGYTGTEYYPELLDELIAKAFLAGEKSGKSEGAKIAVEYAFSRIKEEGTIEGDDIRISHEQLAGILEVGRMKARTS